MRGRQVSDGVVLESAPAAMAATAAVALPGRDAVAPRDERPSASQQRVWVLNQLVPGLSAYQQSSALRLTGPLNRAALTASLADLVRRYAALRTVFPAVEGRPRRAVITTLPVDLPVADLASVAAPEREDALWTALSREASRGFDLERGPLVRAMLLRLGDHEHVLSFTTHALVCDRSSHRLLLEDLGRLYTGYLAGAGGTPGEPLAPESALATADLLDWPEPLEDQALDRQRQYWAEQLNGAAAIQLPTDYPRPAVQTYGGSCESFVLAAPLTDALRALSQQEQVPLSATLLAALQTVLHRYSGQDDIVIGSEAAMRRRDDRPAAIGPFSNTVVLRTDLSGNPSFRELLGRDREILQRAEAHRDLPFDELLAVQPARDQSRSPLFQVEFTVDDCLSPLPVFADLAVRVHTVHTGGSKFDLALHFAAAASGFVGTIEYRSDLFAPATVSRLAGHLQTLLAAATQDPGRRIDTLPLLTGPESHQLLEEWNETGAEYPAEAGIQELIAAQAARTPDAVAVVCEGVALRYRELEAQANRVARRLERLGVGRGTLVGICVERSLDMVVGLLGILKAGGAYLPLDPEFPAERLGFMLEDAQVGVVVTQERLAERLPAHGGAVVYLDGAAVAAEPAEPGGRGGWGEDLAYVLYTSGSTGRPKGVQVSHRAVVNFLCAMGREPGLGPEDVLVAVTTLGFDIAGLELYLPLLVGARVVIATRAVAADGRRLGALLGAAGATVMQATPATWRLLVQAGWAGQPGFKVLCGGEAFPRELANELVERGGEVWNLYGPTETTIWSTCARVEAGAGPVLIGRPIANTALYVLDGEGQPVPIGVPGELYIGGAGVAAGYLGRPELTAERFVPNRFGAGGPRLYRTGDLVRYRADGSVEYLGRLDHQVKVRGFRIELGEIETVLSGHPGVKEGVVLVREDEPGDKRLVAYIVPREEPPAIDELRGCLREKLPAYMVPAIYVVLEAMPLTPNGKIDRLALPAPDRSGSDPGSEIVAPRNEAEARLVAIWQDLLKVRPVGVTDDFFELGGHSLLVGPLFLRIEKAFGKDLPLATIFQARTVEQLAALVADERQLDGCRSLIPIQPHGTRPPLFCVHGGQGISLCFNNLARLLDQDQPIYGLDAWGLDGTRSPHERVEEFAAQYVEDIRVVQARGPYYLAGYCFGGVVAFEMARQLLQRGEEVALVMLFNAAHPRGCYERKVDELRLQSKLHRRRELLSLNPGRMLAALSRSARWRYGRAQRWLKEMLPSVYFRLGVRLPMGWRRQYLLGHTNRVQDRYAPGRYDGALVVIRAEGLFTDPELGWRELAAGGVDAREIPGAHQQNIEMMGEPYVHLLAEQVGEVLERYQARTWGAVPQALEDVVASA